MLKRRHSLRKNNENITYIVCWFCDFVWKIQNEALNLISDIFLQQMYVLYIY